MTAKEKGVLARCTVALIERYQRNGGGYRWFGIDCNFERSCSEYTRLALVRFGFWRGVRLGWARIRRCNQPDLPAKILDPVPNPEERSDAQ